MERNTFKNSLSEEVLLSLEGLLQTSELIDETSDDYSLTSIRNNILSNIKLEKANKVCAESVNAIQAGFSRNPEKLKKSLLVLQFVLSSLENQFDFVVPKIPQVFNLGVEEPLLTKYDNSQMTLSTKLYELLEVELSKPEKNTSFEHTIARVALNFILNEGIQNSSDLALLLSSDDNWFRHDDVFYYQLNDKRQVIGLESVLLLSHLWMSKTNKQGFTKQFILKCINSYLLKRKIINVGQRISYKKLYSAFRVEHVLTICPSALLMLKSGQVETQTSQETFVRLLSQKRIIVDVKKESQSPSYRKWAKLWSGKPSQTEYDLTTDPIKQGNDIVKHFVSQLTEQTVELLPNKDELLCELWRWLDDSKNLEGNWAAWVIIAYCHKLLTKGGVNKPILKIKTIKDYVNTVAKLFIPIFSPLKFEELTVNDWSEKISTLLDLLPSKNRQSSVKNFLDFLINMNIISADVLEQISIASVEVNVSANVIGFEHITRVLGILSTHNSSLCNVARLLLCFGFYGGNRRGEVERLQIRDIVFGDHCITELIRSRKGDTLKSVSANRNIPLECFWPVAEQDLLKMHIQERLINNKNNVNLFESKDINQAFYLITKLIQEVTGDNTLRYHDLRHSFCNWLKLLISYKPLKEEHHHINVLNQEYLSQDRQYKLKRRLGLDFDVTRKESYAVTELMGHGSTAVTLTNYFHLSEFFWLMHKNRYCDDVAGFARKLFGNGTLVTNNYPLQVKNSKTLPSQLNKFSNYEVRSKQIGEEHLIAYIAAETKANREHRFDNLSVTGSYDIFKSFSALTIFDSLNLKKERVSNDLNIPIDIVSTFLDTAVNISKFPSRSKDKLPINPLDSLRSFKHRYLKFLAKKFDKLDIQNISYLNFELALSSILKLSINNNYQLRMYDLEQLIHVVRVFDELGLDLEARIRVKVYMTMGAEHQSVQSCKQHISGVGKELIYAFGYAIVNNIELLFPKKFENYFVDEIKLGENGNCILIPKFSNKGEFTSKVSKAAYTLSILGNKNRIKPKHERAFVLFIHLLKVWFETNKLLKHPSSGN